MVRYFAAIGAAKIARFVRESRNWRVNRWFTIFAIGFLTEEIAEDRLKLEGGNSQLLTVIGKVFSKNQNDASGALFQLSQIAYYHGKSLIDSGRCQHTFRLITSCKQLV